MALLRRCGFPPVQADSLVHRARPAIVEIKFLAIEEIADQTRTPQRSCAPLADIGVPIRPIICQTGAHIVQ